MVESIWDDLKKMQKKMDEMFEDFFESNPQSEKYTLIPSPKTWKIGKTDFSMPLTDFYETDKSIKIEVDLPGIDKKDIKLNVSKGKLEIKAEKKREQKEEKKDFYKMERSYQGFYRSFLLPENADTSIADAKYENGVLKISIPKKELQNHAPKQIEVK